MEKIALIIILLGFVFSFAVYEQMPDEMITHWGLEGEANGYMDKFWGLAIMPLLSLAMVVVFLVIPKIDPTKNIKKFEGYYEKFVVLLLLFLLYLHAIVITVNYGYELDIGAMTIGGIAVILFYAGVVMEKSKRNWFIGIRTPWTMSSDKIWDKTNKLGGKIFKVFGLICVLMVLLGMIKGLFIFFIVCILLATGYLFAYSYFEYKKVEK